MHPVKPTTWLRAFTRYPGIFEEVGGQPPQPTGRYFIGTSGSGYASPESAFSELKKLHELKGINGNRAPLPDDDHPGIGQRRGR